MNSSCSHFLCKQRLWWKKSRNKKDCILIKKDSRIAFLPLVRIRSASKQQNQSAGCSLVGSLNPYDMEMSVSIIDATAISSPVSVVEDKWCSNVGEEWLVETASAIMDPFIWSDHFYDERNRIWWFEQVDRINGQAFLLCLQHIVPTGFYIPYQNLVPVTIAIILNENETWSVYEDTNGAASL